MIIRPMPRQKYKDIETLNKARVAAITSTVMLHNALDRMHKKEAANNMLRRTRAQTVHNSNTSVARLNVIVGDYIMIRTHAKREHRLHSKCSGAMLVKTRDPT